MEFDLTQPDALSFENVQALLASGNDNRDTQLRVDRSGRLYLKEATGPEDLHEEFLFRFHTWDARSGSVGPDAARDVEWVRQVLEKLQRNWPEPKARCLEV